VLDSASLTDHLRSLGLAAEISLALDGAPSCARPDALPLEAEAGWWHFYGLMHRSGLEDAVREAHLLYQKTPDAPSLDRLNKLCIARDRLRRGEQGLEGSEWGEPELDVPSA
jgi:DNA primase